MTSSNMEEGASMCVSLDEDRNTTKNTNKNMEEECGCASEKENFLVVEADINRRGHFVDNLITDEVLRHKFLHTACICLSMIALGWRMSMTGPALPDLRLIINEDLSRASWIVSAIGFGGLAGSLCSGILYDRLSKYAVLVGLTFVLGVASVVTPWCSSFGSMVAIHVLNGACAAGLDTVVVADVVNVWQHESAPFQQAINFASSIGATLSPLTIEPFLAKRHLILHNEANVTTVSSASPQDLNNTYMYSQSIQFEENGIYNTTSVNLDKHAWTYGTTSIHSAFMISGAICLLACVSLVLQYCCLGNVHSIPREIKPQDGFTKNKTIDPVHFPLTRRWQFVFLIMLAVMLSTYVISERTLYSYLMTYLVEHLNWDKTAGSKATMVFWTAFMTGRLLSIAVVKFIRILYVFGLFFGILLVGEILMLISVMFDMSPLIWLSCGFYGLGFSALYASIINWISAKVCPLTGKICSVVFTITATGAIVFPLITGNIMSAVSYDWFIYLEMLLTGFMILLLTVAEILYRILT